MTRLRALLLVVVMGVLSCAPFGDDGDAGLSDGGLFVSPAACAEAPSCTAVLDGEDACGGDPTGRFALCSACTAPVLLPVALFEECPELTVTLLDEAPVSGALELLADGSYVLGYESAVAFAFLLPEVCTVGEECVVGRPDPFLTASACERYDDGSCDCTGVVEQTVAHAGTWAVEAGSLLLTHDDVTDASPYCAEGGTLQLTLPPTSEAPGAGLVLTPVDDGT